jgi:hypothetical protein
MCVCYAGMAEYDPPTPELLDAAIDRSHRSFRIAVERAHLMRIDGGTPLSTLEQREFMQRTHRRSS